MFRKLSALALLATILSLFAVQTARADGIIVPEPPICPQPDGCPLPSPMVQLVIRYHHVDITIDDQVTTTRVDQVFYNPNDWAVEGTYIFPLPQGAAVTSFLLWVDGEPVEGKVLDAEQARRTYREIVSSLQDPALLEYAGHGAVQASIFPIPPGGERRIEIEYTQALAAEGGLLRYVYPLSTEKFSAQPLEQVSVNARITSISPIRTVYSPSHPVAVYREDEFHATASFEASDVLPDSDFALYVSLGETKAFHLLSYRDSTDAQEPDGYFLALMAPEPESGARVVPKDVILVLDHSGSMEGEKFLQAQASVRYILEHLNPEDRFNLIGFSSETEVYANQLVPASQANDAVRWIDRLSAAGGTDIHRALLEAAAIAASERPTYLVFLTDGLPTVGVVESAQILNDFDKYSPASVRLFAFGVGYDVDTFLLDTLAQEHHGASYYVQPGERLDEALSTFYAKISTPVLIDLSLDFRGLSVHDIYPSPLPDLFSGSQIVILGRYRLGGSTDVRLSGTVDDQEQTFLFTDQVFSQQSAAGDPLAMTLPRLWATRKIGYLLNQVRLNGVNEELIDQIVHLSIRYGIITPYTSYLVTEEMPLGAEGRQDIVEDAIQAFSAPQPAAGESAVRKAADQGMMVEAEVVTEILPAGQYESDRQVRSAAGRTFLLKDGVWMDTAYDPAAETVRVAFLSEDYFKLLEQRPSLSGAFALGPRVVVVSAGTAIEVVALDAQPDPINLAPDVEPDPVKRLPEEHPEESIESTSSQDEQAWFQPCSAGLLPLGVILLTALCSTALSSTATSSTTLGTRVTKRYGSANGIRDKAGLNHPVAASTQQASRW